ncbi:hypothetical protein GJAV_G00228120 [Gymnothorax javanicus]|nr:hypothetical protein GJAV_G00228120 [Gymnothorax javanicus]
MFTLATMADDNLQMADGVTEEDKNRIIETVADLRQSNAALQAEIEMFEHFIWRQEAKDAGALPDGMGQISLDTGLSQSRKARMAQEKHRLTMEQKCDVVEQEYDALKEELQDLRDRTKRQVQNHQATMEEAEIRLAEIKKANTDFDRDIAKGIREGRHGVMDAEKVVRYLEEKMKAKDALVKKTRLKTGTARVQRRKVELQLKQKDEVREARRDVDFQQLKMKNTKYLQQIDTLNQDLLRLKQLTGSTQQILHSQKTKLQQLANESKLLRNEISSLDDVVPKMEEEIRLAEQECTEAEAENAQLREQLESFSVPPLLDYIKAKSEHDRLEQTVRSWERKTVIAEMALKNSPKVLEQLQPEASAEVDLTQ